MIIARYISKQVLLLTAALSFVLLFVAVLIRLLNYLGDASEGELDPGILFLLMSFRLPEFIQLTLPLALMLGILLAYGRMYAENEMTVLIASGLSRLRLLMYTQISALVILLLLAGLVFILTPWGLLKSSLLLEQQKDLNEFDIIAPGVFQDISNGARTTYTQSIEEDLIRDVFMHETEQDRLTVADFARLQEDADGRLVVFDQGSLSEGMASGSAYSVTNFSELAIRLPQREINLDLALEKKALKTRELLSSSDPAYMAELQWRISLLLLIPVLAMLAVPLSRVNPRQGRFAQLVPAILLYIAYFGLLLVSRDWLAQSLLPAFIGLWWVHLLFLVLAVLLFQDKVSFSGSFSSSKAHAKT
jgi:lipopolysaccharide export system permease protein